MKTGALNKAEKAQIIDMLKNKKTVPEMAQSLDRAEKTVNKYIDEVKSIFAVEEPQKPEEVEEELEQLIDKKVLNRARNQLAQSGLDRPSINLKIKQIIKTSTPEALKIMTVDTLVSECIRRINVHDIMINKTGGGNSGVAIMTEAGSEKSDESKQNRKPVKNPNVYKLY